VDLVVLVLVDAASTRTKTTRSTLVACKGEERERRKREEFEIKY
jgi:hypothetical protein